MHLPSRKNTLLLLLAIFLAVSVAVIPDIISEEMRGWCVEMFGPGFAKYFAGFFVLGTVGVLFLTGDLGRYLGAGAKSKPGDRYNIPPGPKTRNLINQAKAAVADAKPEQALRHLSEIRQPALEIDIAALSSRLVEFRRTSRQGVDSRDEENRILNRINNDILELIKALKQELSTGTENYQIIKAYLKKRYVSRLEQKLAKRQPVNLRRLINTDVVPKGMSPAFISYSSNEISGALVQTFHEARGRLLLVGAPGAGKTTLMLQLVLELLESEPDALPVLLNLATWSKGYITLETWLKKILPAETGTSDRYAAKIIQQNHLILLFDGFDEVREEDRLSCLEAINRYGEDGQRRYVISSRKQEFKDTNKSLLIHLPIEVCPLTFEQLKSEIQRLWENGSQPERGAKLLLDAIEKDPILSESINTPFYFNTLQVLFNAGKTLGDLQFKANTTEGRQVEIRKRFVEYELGLESHQKYPGVKAGHWLSFLASRMSSLNIVAFELRSLQYNWWTWSRLQLLPAILVTEFVTNFVYSLSISFLGGVFGRMYLKSAEGWVYGILAGLIYLVFLMLYQGIVGGIPIIRTKDSINWSWKIRIKRFRENSFSLLVILLILGLFGWLGAGIYGLFIGGLVGIIIYTLVDLLVVNSTDIIQINSSYERFYASMKSLHFSILQHNLLCYQLRLKNLLPPNLIRFLNEMSVRHILETDGATWRFRNGILQDYFTALFYSGNHQLKNIQELVANHLHDNKWKDLFLSVASMLPDNNDLLLQISKENKKLLVEPDLLSLLQNAELSLLPSNNKILLNIGRLEAILMIQMWEFETFTEEYWDLVTQTKPTKEERQNDKFEIFKEAEMENKINEIIEYLESECEPIIKSNEDIPIDTIYAKQLMRTIEWQDPNWKALFMFLDANLLMIKILKETNNVSQTTRKYILEEMLTAIEK